jgi:hypothetical protein
MNELAGRSEFSSLLIENIKFQSRITKEEANTFNIEKLNIPTPRLEPSLMLAYLSGNSRCLALNQHRRD